jgi:glycosyltransferase involved in cell wall biosynthesis
MSLQEQARHSPPSGVRSHTRVLGVVVANGFSSEARTFANLLSECDGAYDPLVLCHVDSNPHPKDAGAADDFERVARAPMFRFDSGWRRNDDGRRSRMAKARSWTALHLQLPSLLAVARQHRPDVIYSSQQRWDSHLAALLSHTLGVPHVIHLHYTIGPSLGIEVLRRLKTVAGVVCVSNYIRTQAIASGVAEERIEVLPNTMYPLPPPAHGSRDALRCELGIPESALVFAFVARLASGKGHADALHAFSRVARAVPSARLLVVGDGPLAGSLETLVRELSLEERVQLLGYRRDVPALLAASDAFVHPSREEPFGLSILEAMAAGLPPIAYREAGPAEVIRDGGLLVEPGDVTALADAMSLLGRDPELRRRMGSASLQDVKARFSPKVEALRFARFLSSFSIRRTRSGLERERRSRRTHSA